MKAVRKNKTKATLQLFLITCGFVLMLIGLLMAIFYNEVFIGLSLMFVIALLFEHFEEKEPILKLWTIPCPRCSFYSLALIQPDIQYSNCDCGCFNISQTNVRCNACGHFLWDQNTQKVIEYRVQRKQQAVSEW